tara:strand:+ start:2003 stop:2983 length:981 start_codon:yes stop_codon:yes gene_type:complete
MKNPDEKDIDSLLTGLSKRDMPPSEAVERAYAQTLAVWEATDYSAKPEPATKYGYITALAASVVLAVSAAFYALLPAEQAADHLYAVSYSTGSVIANNSAIGESQALDSGSQIRVTNNAYAELTRRDGTIVRLDSGVLLDIVDSNTVNLRKGRIYIDAEHGGSLTVTTSHGLVKDIGTIFEVSVNEEELVATVRDGEIYIKTESVSLLSSAQDEWGESTTFIPGKPPVSRKIKRSSEYWGWLSSTYAPIDIEDKSLDQVLRRVSRELGVKLVYANPAAEVSAKASILHGKLTIVEGDLSGALDNVMKTTKLKRVAPETDELLIDFR